jgi:hypothetical protein
MQQLSYVFVFACLLQSLPPAVSATEKMNGFDLENALVPVDQIHSGGVSRDGIPALYTPKFVDASSVDFLSDKDRVLGVHQNGEAKAYPLKIMNYHEIVNDDFNGAGVVVSFCPLCGSGIAFAVDVEHGGFGVSGLLYNSDVLMYDRKTESLWSQILGQAVSGPARGTSLEAIPISNTNWETWRQRYPGTKVLSPETGYGANYDRDPYASYRRSNRLWFPVAAKDRRFKPKSMVIGIGLEGLFKAYPLNELPDAKTSIEDSFAGRRLTVQYDKSSASADVFDASGTEWPSVTLFWFAWVAFHPDTEVYVSPDDK